MMMLIGLLPIVSEAEDLRVSTDYGNASGRSLQSSSVRVFTEADFENRSSTVSEWLEHDSGLRVKRSGDASAPSTASIRGSTPEQVAVYLNGVLLNAAAHTSVNLSQLSLRQVKRITIYKNRVPLGVGGHPIGGAIMIDTMPFTPSPDDATGRSLATTLRYGSFNTIAGSAAYGETRPALTWQLSYTGLHSDGDFTFLDDNGTPANSADDATVTRQNNASTQHEWQGSVDWQPMTDSHLSFFQRVRRDDRGVPGIGSFQSQTADVSDTQSLSSLTWKRNAFIPEMNYTQRNSFVWNKSQFSDPNAEIGIGDPQDNDDDSLQYTHEERLDWQHETYVLRGLASYDWESFRPESFLDSPAQGPENHRHRFGLGSEGEIALWHNRLSLAASLAYSQLRNGFNDQDPSTSTPSGFTNTQVEHGWTAAAEAEWALISDWLWIDAEWVRALRPPNFAELFGDRGGVVGNPQLHAERSWGGSGGVRIAHPLDHPVLRDFFFTVSYFDRHSDELIQFIQSSGVARADNIGASRTRGLEVASEWSLWRLIDLETSFTWQDITDIENSSTVPGHPRYAFFGGITAHRRLGPGEFQVFGDWNYEDERYLDRNNSRLVVHQHRVDAGVSYAFRDTRFFVEASNLTGDQLVDVVGYPLPGRAVTVGAAWEFTYKEQRHD